MKEFYEPALEELEGLGIQFSEEVDTTSNSYFSILNAAHTPRHISSWGMGGN
jgi:hypothetical protein